ncbi:glycosyl transferase family 1 [Bacteroidia bacterium]|nr:glycosyl transferase family 1 [Bacteroidia bacterium]
MKKIAIVTNGTLPIPAVKGGAVETLLNSFIDENENTNDFDLTVFSIADENISPLKNTYRNTHFIYIKTPLLYKIKRAIRYFINKIHANAIPNQFLSEVLKYKTELRSADFILIENNPSFAPFMHKIVKNPIVLYLHNDYLNVKNQKSAINILAHISHVIGVSDYIEKRVKEIAPPNCKVCHVHNGINLSKFDTAGLSNARSANRLKYGFKDDDLVIIYVGRIQESKGIKVLLDAINKIPESYSVKLLVVGSSAFKDSRKTIFLREVEKLGNQIPNRVIFTGFIDYELLSEIYASADCAIFPSLAPEAFSLVSIEAQASGLPVIITNSGGMPETVSNESGIILEIDNNLEKKLIETTQKLALDKELRSTMAEAAKKNVQKFNDKVYYKTLSEKLKEIH